MLLLLIHSFMLLHTGSSQTTVAQCEKIQCPTIDCNNPIRLKGQCCEVCPGESKSNN